MVEKSGWQNDKMDYLKNYNLDSAELNLCSTALKNSAKFQINSYISSQVII